MKIAYYIVYFLAPKWSYYYTVYIGYTVLWLMIKKIYTFLFI